MYQNEKKKNEQKKMNQNKKIIQQVNTGFMEKQKKKFVTSKPNANIQLSNFVFFL